MFHPKYFRSYALLYQTLQTQIYKTQKTALRLSFIHIRYFEKNFSIVQFENIKRHRSKIDPIVLLTEIYKKIRKKTTTVTARKTCYCKSVVEHLLYSLIKQKCENI